LIDQLKKAEDKNEFECDYGVDCGKLVNFYGYYRNAYYAGIPAENLLETMTIPEACKHVRKLIKDTYDIDVYDFQIGFYYGEVGE
jgi:hypothetical protein